MKLLPDLRITRENVELELPNLMLLIKPSWKKEQTEIKESMKLLPDIRLIRQCAGLELPKLMHLIKPSWKKSQMEMKNISSGFSCLMYYSFDKENPSDGVTIRAKSNTTRDFPNIKDAAYETKVVQAMNANGLFPNVLAEFANGYCYEYIKGKPLFVFSKQSTLEEPVIRLMARKLAAIHSVKVEGFDYSTPDYFEPIFTILNEKYPTDNAPEGTPPRDEVYQELQLIKEYAIKTKSPLVQCHGDPHPGNIVYDSEAGVVTYVDWEISHVGFQASDLGTALEVLKSLNLTLPENCDRKYLRYYLEKWYEIQGRNESDVTEEDVDKLEIQANVFRLCAQLMWVSLMTVLFCVNKPEYLTNADMKRLHEGVKKERKTVLPDEPVAAEDMGIDLVKNIYTNYKRAKDGILDSVRS